MIVFETKDPEVIKSVLCHPEIYPLIKDDNCPESSEFEPPMDAKYIAGQVGDNTIGIMVYHPTDEGLKCHIQVLPEYRGKYAKDFARAALSYGDDVLYCEIPVCFPNVIRFAESFGFEQTHITKHAHLLNGESHDVVKMRQNHVIC